MRLGTDTNEREKVEEKKKTIKNVFLDLALIVNDLPTSPFSTIIYPFFISDSPSYAFLILI